MWGSRSCGGGRHVLTRLFTAFVSVAIVWISANRTKDPSKWVSIVQGLVFVPDLPGHSHPCTFLLYDHGIAHFVP